MRITESQLRRIVRQEAARLAEGPDDDLHMPGVSRYGLYGDGLDGEVDEILAPVVDAVLEGRAALERFIQLHGDQGSQDPEARDELHAAFDRACRGKLG